MTPRHDASEPHENAGSTAQAYDAPRVVSLGSVTDLTQGQMGGGSDTNGGSLGGASGHLP